MKNLTKLNNLEIKKNIERIHNFKKNKLIIEK